MSELITIHDNFPGKPWKGRRVEVKIKGRKHPVEVSLYPGHNDERAKIKDYGVNWCALGTVDAETAAIFADAVGRASVEAQRLTNTYGGKDLQ
jgi:hypothetical protein